MKKVIALIISIMLVLVITIPATAITKTVEKGSTLKPVQLVMYLVGDPQPDEGRVYDAVNKKLKADINTTVKRKYLTWADYQTKYSLIFASGVNFDLVYTADWVFYGQQATKNAFKEVTKADVQKYAPDYFAKIPNEFWSQLKINGKVFMLPYLNKQVVGHLMAFTRGDLREKYKLPAIKTTSDLDKYLFTIAKNENQLKGMDGTPTNITDMINNIYYKQPNNLMFFKNAPLLTVKLDDPNGKVMSALDDPAYLEVLKHAKELADAGVWSKNVLTNKTDNYENYKAGLSSLVANHSENAIQFYNDTMVAHPDWKPEINDLQADKIHEASSATRSGMGFNAHTKNYERSLMMVNLFGTHKDYYDLTTYGIEGLHYKPVGDNKLVSLPNGTKNFVAKNNCPWGWENKAFMRFPVNVPDSVTGLEASWLKKGIASTTSLVSFNFVDTTVKNELAACSNLISTRGVALQCGELKDTEGELEKLKADLKAAGYDKIIAEYQKQVTAFLNS